jgi:hypothetical protein
MGCSSRQHGNGWLYGLDSCSCCGRKLCAVDACYDTIYARQDDKDDESTAVWFGGNVKWWLRGNPKNCLRNLVSHRNFGHLVLADPFRQFLPDFNRKERSKRFR